MALIGNLTVTVQAKTDEFAAGMQKATQTLRLTQAQAADVAKGFGSLGTAFTQAGTQASTSGKGFEQASQSLKQVKQASDDVAGGVGSKGFLSGATHALAFVGAVSGIQLGISGLSQVFQSTIASVLGFQSALANVNTLGSNSVAVQQMLREQLLLLPPALGSSVDLAKGLYDVLSAGIPATESVKFLAVSANLAKAGLAEVGTTTEALTKTMAAFNIPTKDAGQLADVLFKVVDLGQGTLQQFAHAFPQVTQGAAALGLSFVDTSAAMATLTQTFKNADTAATGFRSLLGQLVQNSDKFAQSGVNIQQVIGEQGLVGALKVLQTLTGGNAEKMKVFVNDIEGLAAAQALTGPQFQLLLENQGKLADSTGVVAAGVKLQTETLAAAFSTTANAFTTYVTALTTGTKETSVFQSVLAAFTKGFQDHTAAIIAAEKREEAYRETQARLRLGQEQVKISADDATTSIQFLGDTYQNTQKYVASYDQAAAKAAATLEAKIVATEKDIATLKIEADAHTAGFTANETLSKSLTLSTVHLTEQAKAAQALNVDLQTLNANVKAFKPGDLQVIDVGKAERDVQATIGAIQRIAETGKVNFGELLKRAEGMTQGIRETFGTVPPTWQAMLDVLNDRARTELPKIGALFEKLGLQSKEALQQAAGETGKDLDALLTTTQKKTTDSVELVRDASGKLLIQQKVTVDGVGQQISQSVTATNASLVTEFHKTVDAINKGEFQRIPDDLRASLDKLAPIAQKATGEVATVTHDAFGNVVVSLEKVGTAATHAGEGLALSGQEAEAAAANYRRATGATDGLENSLQGLSAAAIASGHSLNAAGQEVNKYGLEIAKTLSNSDKLGQLIGKTTFATDKAGLFAQLQTATHELQTVREHGEIEGTQGGRAFTIAALEKQVATITEKIKTLGFDTLGNPLKDAATKSTELTTALDRTDTVLQKATTTTGHTAASVGILTTQFADLAKGARDAAQAVALVPGASVITGPNGARSPGIGSVGSPFVFDEAAAALTSGRSANGSLVSTGADAFSAYQTALREGLPDNLVQQKEVTDLLKVEGNQLRILTGNQGDQITITDAANQVLLQYTDLLMSATRALTTSLPTAHATSASIGTSSSTGARGTGGVIGMLPALPQITTTDRGGNPYLYTPLSGGLGDSLTVGLGSVNPSQGVTRQVQRFAQGGVVQGPGGSDSELAFVTPGERVQTRAQQQQDRVLSVSIGDIHIHMTPGSTENPLEMSRIAQQALVTALGPALNESMARGGGRFA